MKNIFSVKIPPNLVDSIKNGIPSLCHQFLPDEQENTINPIEQNDPIGDEKFSVLPGAIHRYSDRLLVLLTRRCMGHCRFCFRRLQVSNSIPDLSLQEIERICEYLIQKNNIREIIISGGEPLIMNNDFLETMFSKFSSIPSIDILRIHTRMPIAYPQKFDAHFLKILGNVEKPIWMVIHINSIDEITKETKQVIQNLRKLGIPLLSQTVLLKNVNDTTESLKSLFCELIRNQVKPYYLHYPDLVPGTSHFRIPLERAVELVSSLRGCISGFAIPDLVVDIPNGYGKVVVSPTWTKKINDTCWEFTSPITGEKILVDYSNY